MPACCICEFSGCMSVSVPEYHAAASKLLRLIELKSQSQFNLWLQVVSCHSAAVRQWKIDSPLLLKSEPQICTLLCSGDHRRLNRRVHFCARGRPHMFRCQWLSSTIRIIIVSDFWLCWDFRLLARLNEAREVYTNNINDYIMTSESALDRVTEPL